MTETGRGGPGPCVRFLVVWFALLALPAWEGARAAAPAFPAGGRVREAPVEAGAQDVLSVFYQVALFPPGAAAFEADVATGKGTYRRVFRRIGESRIELPVGELRTLNVRAEEADGERIDLWLALDRGNLPVRIRMVDRKGNVVEQQAVEIDIPAVGEAS